MIKIIILSLFVFLNAYSQEVSIGMFIGLDGDVKIHRNSKVTGQAMVEDKVFKGDAIVTGYRSGARILLNDDTILDIKAKSKIIINELNTEINNRSADIEVSEGALRASVNKKMFDSKNYKIRTKTSVFAVRGTDFLISDDNDVSKLIVFEGTVSAQASDQNIEQRSGDVFSVINNEVKRMSLKSGDLDEVYQMSRYEDVTYLQNIVVEDVKKSRYQGVSTVRVLNNINQAPVVKIPSQKLRSLNVIMPVADVVSPALIDFVSVTISTQIPY